MVQTKGKVNRGKKKGKAKKKGRKKSKGKIIKENEFNKIKKKIRERVLQTKLEKKIGKSMKYVDLQLNKSQCKKFVRHLLDNHTNQCDFQNEEKLYGIYCFLQL